MRSSRKPKGEGHARRAEILSAAERIFVEHGYEGATIRKIADEVGLSSTALYMHFADKAEILHEICREAFETLTADATGAPRFLVQVDLALLVGTTLLATGVGLMAAVIPARRAAGLDPAAAIHSG